MATKVWFITGTSKGFGRVWAEAALARGDQVAATARDPETLSALTKAYGEQVAALKLDVTNKAQVEAAIAETQKRFGRLDVVVNNAGYGLFGAVEEVRRRKPVRKSKPTCSAHWGNPSGTAHHARTRLRSHHSSFLDRRRQRVSHHRFVPRV